MNNSFDSIDKLVEFGMSIAVAQQMINTMNHCITNMVVPGVQNQMTNQINQYFIVINGAQSGPFLQKDLIDFVKNKQINKDTLMWKPGLSGWVYAETIPEVNKLFVLYN